MNTRWWISTVVFILSSALSQGKSLPNNVAKWFLEALKTELQNTKPTTMEYIKTHIWLGASSIMLDGLVLSGFNGIDINEIDADRVSIFSERYLLGDKTVLRFTFKKLKLDFDKYKVGPIERNERRTFERVINNYDVEFALKTEPSCSVASRVYPMSPVLIDINMNSLCDRCKYVWIHEGDKQVMYSRISFRLKSTLDLLVCAAVDRVKSLKGIPGCNNQ